jgi:thiol:disulfide interchange protein DsbD
MKKIFGLLGLLLFSFNIYAQIQEPVKWTYAIENNGSENPTLVIKASIDDHWHVYSQFVGEGGPLPTTFKFTPNPNYQLIKGVL